MAFHSRWLDCEKSEATLRNAVPKVPKGAFGTEKPFGTAPETGLGEAFGTFGTAFSGGAVEKNIYAGTHRTVTFGGAQWLICEYDDRSSAYRMSDPPPEPGTLFSGNGNTEEGTRNERGAPALAPPFKLTRTDKFRKSTGAENEIFRLLPFKIHQCRHSRG